MACLLGRYRLAMRVAASRGGGQPASCLWAFIDGVCMRVGVAVGAIAGEPR